MSRTPEPPDDIAMMLEAFNHALKTGSSAAMDVAMQLADDNRQRAQEMSDHRLRRDVLAMAKTIDPTAGVEPTRNGHYRVQFRGPLGTRCVFVSGSPSDRRSERNVRSDMRRAARAAGIQTMERTE